ncbi:MAG: IS66 family transposase [Pseudomonadales bacterium]
MPVAAANPSDTANPAAMLHTLRAENIAQREEITQLKHQLDWFKRQLFGSTSEKRVFGTAHQPLLAGLEGEPVEPLPEQEKQTVTYQRGKAQKKRGEDCANDSGLRFDDDVPVTVIRVEPPELQGPDADHYEIISYKHSHRLAQHQCSHEILCYERPVLKRKDTAEIMTPPAPTNVLDNSVADVSFLAGMLVDKFLYHLPLYRQHQRLLNGGIQLSRTTLTNLTKRSIELLRPIVDAQLGSVLQSRVLSMDETPIKAGLSKNKKGKGTMKQAWFWPVMGDQDEIVFTYSPSRARHHIESVLKNQFSGTLISDGYKAYASYAAKNDAITHANCWIHGRRGFEKAEDSEPDEVRQVLANMGHLYRIERQIQEAGLHGEKKRTFRLKHSKPVVDQLFSWFDKQRQRPELLPSNPFSQAMAYMQAREAELKVFLEDPDVPMDTNHTERALRPIPLGRRNWLFCWTEIGAEQVGIIQSLMVTCKLQDVDPYTYLVDVLQRVAEHPASDVQALTPRLWKEQFVAQPLRSDLHTHKNQRQVT